MDHPVGSGASLHIFKSSEYLWIILWVVAVAYTILNRVNICGSSCGMWPYPTHPQIESVFLYHPVGCGPSLHNLKSSQYF
jgi:hypothetical protein